MDSDMRDSAAQFHTKAAKPCLKNSLQFTIQHPLFGDGTGMFAVGR